MEKNDITEKRIRLQKMLAQCGICSRRKAEILILEGKIKVNGITAKLGDKIAPKSDKITVEGKHITTEKKHYIAINKPRGYITTTHDEKGRKTICDLVKNIAERLYPVGRLDKDSEGLLLMTNDGDFANAIIHPSRSIGKIYIVTVEGKVTGEMVQKFKKGVISQNELLAAADVEIVDQIKNKTILKMVLHQGKTGKSGECASILDCMLKN